MGIVWFQKISIPPPQREIEILEGYGGGGEGSRAQEFLEGRALNSQLFWFPNALLFSTASSFDLALQKSSLTY